MYTGNGDINKLRTYYQVWGKPYISVRNPDFNGNTSSWLYTTPYRGNVPLKGTDGTLSRPDLDDGNVQDLWVYIDTLFRWMKISKTGDVKSYAGVDTYRFEINDSEMVNRQKNPEMATFY
jgi:hypothetical protein